MIEKLSPILFFVLLSCGSSKVNWKDSGIISGKVNNSASFGVSDCEENALAKANLYQYQKSASAILISTTSVNSDGEFSFSKADTKNVSLNSDLRYFVIASSCTSQVRASVLTGRFGLALNATTTIVFEALQYSEHLADISLKEIGNLQVKIGNQDNFSKVVKKITASDDIKKDMADYISADELSILPPIPANIFVPGVVMSGQAATLKASLFHWNPDYKKAIEWKIDGTTVSTKDEYEYTSSSLGTHNVTVFLGEEGTNGLIDPLKPYTKYDYTITVE